MKTKLSSMFLVAVSSFALTSCGKGEAKITITAEDDALSISRNESVQFSAVGEGVDIDESALKYYVADGAATVNETGLVTCNVDAEVNSKINIYAEYDGIKSNTYTLNVADTMPTAIEISTDKNYFVTIADSIQLNTLTTPAYATVKQVTYSLIEDGSDYAVIDTNNVLRLKDTIDFENLKNQEIIVKATLKADESIEAYKTFVINGIVPNKINLTMEEEGKTTINRKDEIKLNLGFEPEDATVLGVQFEFVSGGEIAQVENNILSLKKGVDLEEYYGTFVEVQAVSAVNSDIKSKSIKLLVEKLETYIDVEASPETINYEQTSTVTVNCVSGSGDNSYTLAITKGADFAQVSSSGVVSIKEGHAGDAINHTIDVTATSNANAELTETVTINVVPLYDINVKSLEYIYKESSVNHVDVEIYENGSLITNVDSTKLKYYSNTTDIFTIDVSTGNITPVNHGVGEVKVVYDGKDYGLGKVYVMVSPTSLDFSALTDLVKTNGKLYYAKNETLDLSVVASKNDTLKATDKVTYKFEMLDSSEQATGETGDSVATVTDNKITFKKTGNVKVTVKSDASLNGKTVANEVSNSIIINVNEGRNVRTQQDLVNVTTHDAVINFVDDIMLQGDAFGLGGNNSYAGLTFYGDTKIYGNGYKLSSKNLALHTEAENASGGAMLYFYPEGYNGETCALNDPYDVEIRDLEVLGCGSVTSIYSGNDSASQGKQVIGNDGKFRGTFDKAFEIGFTGFSETNKQAIRESGTYLNNVKLENVNVKDFRFGLRIDHGVNAFIKDTYVAGSFESGMILSQCKAVIENPRFGQVGTFAIEMAPDEMLESSKSTNHPLGTAGVNYNEVASLKLNGEIYVNNYNNGQATPAMQAFAQSMQATVPYIINAISSATIDAIVGMFPEAKRDAIKQSLSATSKNALFRNGDDTAAEVNMFLLIFVDFSQFTGYNLGNQQGYFGTFSTDAGEDNMITLTDLLSGSAMKLAGDPSYSNFDPTSYQYIRVDLDLRTMVGADIGDAIVINQAYKAKN